MPITWTGHTTDKLDFTFVQGTLINADDDNNGFTKIIPSSDTRKIYLSVTDGNDSNDGLSPQTPKLTWAAALALLRDDFPDHIYLDERDDFVGDVLLHEIRRGRSYSEPAVIGRYGAGTQRPKVQPTTFTLGGGAGTRRHWQFVGIHFYTPVSDPVLVQNEIDTNAAYDPREPYIKHNFIDGHYDILHEDCVFDHIELASQGGTGSNNQNNIKVRRNIFTGAYIADSNIQETERPSSLFLNLISGLLVEDNVFDYGGWHPTVGGQLGGVGTLVGAAANDKNHNIYIQFDCDGDRTVVKGNVTCRGASHGMQQRPGGYMLDNYAGKNAIGLFQAGNPNEGVNEFFASFTKSYNNVVQLGFSMAKGVDWQNAGTTGAIWGFELAAETVNIAEMESTIVSFLAPDDTNEPFTRQPSAFVNSGSFAGDNNTVLYHYDTPTQGDGLGLTDPDRDLGTYYQKLVTDGDLTGSEPGTDDFDKMMGVMKSRQVGTWNPKFTAYAVNDYIRIGYDVPKYIIP